MKIKNNKVQQNKNEVVEAFISRCFKDKQPMSISPVLGERYTINNKEYIFTEEILEKMKQSERVRVRSSNSKMANIDGVNYETE